MATTKSAASRTKPAAKKPARSGTRRPARAKSSAGSKTAQPPVTVTQAVSVGSALAALAAAAFGLYRLAARRPSEGTEPTDLMGDSHPGADDRAIEAFRPDPTAPVPESEREALLPALAGAGAPRLVAGQAAELERTAESR
jgi:hypothetical protein